jgi:hypothetical protein
MRLATIAVLVGCSSSGTSSPPSADFPGDAYVVLPTDSGRMRVEVRTAPDQPPARGVVSVQLSIMTPSGTPIDGLRIDAVPWMPSMGHGASIKPSVSAAGQGRYVLANVDFFMPGQWELLTTIADNAEDHVTPTFSIP